MADFNRVIMIGNLTRDPEHRQLPSGQAVCRLGLASNRQYRNKQTGSMVQEVCFIDVDVWGPQAESCKQYLQKGRPVLIEGRLKLDTWQDASGQSRSKHSIVADRVVFLGTASAGAEVDEFEGATSGTSADSTVTPQLEKDLLDQIDQIKNRAKKSKPKKEDGLMEGAFKDEPPFQDDLPF
ncbi:single-stranded DNA-binding protein [Candidatus Dependentiae bacterium]|nr:single-stranded DNA-binding protein [Candidatus Dependentiae bacterium]